MAQTLSIDDLKDRLLAQLPVVIDRYAPPATGSYRKMGLYFTLNPGRADRSVGSFCIHETGAKAGKWNDFATGDHGDVLALIALSLNLPMRDAIMEARAFLGLETESPELKRKREVAAAIARERRQADEARAAEAAQTRRNNAKAMWLSAQERIAATPVAAYLANRGLDLASLGHQPRALRYHPECHYLHEVTDEDTGEVTTQRMKLPAMVAAICDAKGQHIATHRTYLAINAQGLWAKAPVPDAKKVLGDFRGGSIRLSSGIGPRGGKGAPLNDCPPGTRVYLAEGIETGLSAVLIRPDIRVLAAVSLSNMGSIDLPANVAEVVLISDGDTHPEAVAAFDRAIAAHAAKGRSVMVVPAIGPKIDLNDALQGAQKQGAA